jgi:hypothetical protein
MTGRGGLDTAGVGDCILALSSINFSSMPNTQDHDLISCKIKHDTIVTDAKSV